MTLWLVWAVLPAPALAQQLTNRSLPGKQVWVSQLHEIAYYDYPPNNDYYGAHYPLTLQPSYQPRRPTDNLSRYIESGITGIHHLVHEYPGAPAVWEGMLTDADAYNGAITIAPELIWLDGAANVIKQYAAKAAGHPSAARVTHNGVSKLVVYSYGSRYNGTAAQWQAVKDELAAAGVPIFFVGDLVTEGNVVGNQAKITPYFSCFDAHWNFDPSAENFWPDLVKLLNDYNRPFAGGAMIGYNREPNGGYDDSRATGRYRNHWELSLASGVQWQNLVTWNDVSELHDLWPTSNWNWTLADLTAFYSAQMRGVAYPERLRTPQLYVTTPQRVNVGQTKSLPAEALALNTGSAAVSVQIQLVDGNGAPVGAAGSAAVGAGKAGAATLSVNLTALPAKRFLRAKATMTNASGAVVQQVLSAPILVYDTYEQTSDVKFSRTHYNSVPAYRALGSVGLSVAGDPRAAGGTTATVAPAAGTTVRFAEVLHNTYSVKNLFNQALSTAVPAVDAYREAKKMNTSAGGFYVARVIDEQERVGYSDPVYFAPPLRQPDNPAATAPGLDYAYFEQAGAAEPNLTQLTPLKIGTVATIDLTPRSRQDLFAFRYTGYLEVPTDGNYGFSLRADDGCKLYIGDRLVADASSGGEGSIGLKAGKHAVTITYYEAYGDQSVTVSYAGPGIAKQVIPASAFSRAVSGLANGLYTLTARHSGKALDVRNASALDTAGVIQWPANGGANQRWRVEAAGNGTYKLTAQHSGKCLDVAGSGTSNGTKVQQYTDNGTGAQRWRIEPTTDGYYRLINHTSGKGLDVSGVSQANAAKVHQWEYLGQLNQQWKLEPVAGSQSAASAPAAHKPASLWAFPNPSPDGRATLRLTAEAAQPATVYVRDGQGQLVSMLSVPVRAGQTDFRLPATLPAGTYFLQTTLDGEARRFTLQVK
ncbi:RICIN domain-containing protein [Hymenobacter weizhouensis]|uniref:RICIN domain-containing protein n=1 Tax=Hymenobacter sp. YIM 151500-1 TaxID=2987689 RepID=UPI00222679B4|nr:RICIN domain-containing protein [Hymenobacter sp. YIM 151500-1]UYZ64947.1 RICIN domain-containing protein [Hymenobacter sp. YIM 151500-1]